MKARRMCSLVLTVLVLLGCSSLPAQAADLPEPDQETARVIARASGRFSMTVKANTYSVFGRVYANGRHENYGYEK